MARVCAMATGGPFGEEVTYRRLTHSSNLRYGMRRTKIFDSKSSGVPPPSPHIHCTYKAMRIKTPEHTLQDFTMDSATPKPNIFEDVCNLLPRPSQVPVERLDLEVHRGMREAVERATDRRNMRSVLAPPELSGKWEVESGLGAGK